MSEVTLSNEALLGFIDELLKDGKASTFLVSGNSMRPFFKHNKTYVTITKDIKYNIYDVILYKINEKYYLHRIVSINEKGYKCQGDATITYEYPTFDQVIGKVVSYQNRKRVIHAHQKLYQIKVKFWMMLRPLRKILVRTMRLSWK